MKTGRVQLATVWLCLLSFGLDMALHAMAFVVCSSAGGARLEWVCEKDERGACLHAGVERDFADRDAPEGLPPCEDRPVGDDHDRAHHLLAQLKQNGHAEFVFPPVMTAAPPSFAFEPPVLCDRPRVDQRVRPPDSVARMRTIIMNV